ncbi:uncharacterized protein FOMMEDRAFT_158865 [Fomitiporia mediterranea MF3/22]|uniref:uncharacterized protein n=1 Tax=Fomitiporia mediterranea (strain MF3/22) TaxID=694068 RepID=UPI000440772A|nr:uncharacterized protein FOMMEDRAFT_158865 [Fomitiporia mediterranea MF3/22]EJD01711.1 hypothetical protein FOMMEDRAFT_158865 [Fomitiporia mediterranea MF3/22]
MSEELGCVQNPDGTLKDASEIVFTYSREASPVNLSALLPDIHTSTGIHPQTSTVNDASLPKDPAHSKAPKLKHQKLCRGCPIAFKAQCALSDTIHDLASLRLHPDGSRVQAHSGSSKHRQNDISSESNIKARTTRRTRQTTRDRQENWIALDAGGTASIKQRRCATLPREKRAEENAEGLVEDKADDAEVHVRSVENSAGRQLNRRAPFLEEDTGAIDGVEPVKDSRTKKRRKFYHDFSFLDPLRTSSPEFLSSVRASSSRATSPSQNVIEGDQPLTRLKLPAPSSDLLKCIHYYASEYYTARGCLFDAPAESRRATKARKHEKLRNAVAEDSGQVVLGENISRLDSDGSGHPSDGSDDDADKRSEKDGDGKASRRQPVGLKKGKRQKLKEIPRRDMYKAFDGSALMAIGMLLQEHVAGLTNAEPPEDWVQHRESLKALGVNEIRGGKRTRKKLKVEEDGTHERAGSEARGTLNGSQLAEEAGEMNAADGNDHNRSDNSLSESSSSKD